MVRVKSQDIHLINDTETDWIDDRSQPEVEFEAEVERMHEQELTNLRVLEWLHDLPADPKETILTMSIRLASNTSVMTTPSSTELLQLAPYVFPNPTSI